MAGWARRETEGLGQSMRAFELSAFGDCLRLVLLYKNERFS